MADEPLSAVEPLTSGHDRSDFDCGTPELTDWLRRFALTTQQGEAARVYVVHRGHRVRGYYALATGGVTKADAPARIGTGLGAFDVPVLLLARLAVDTREQGRGLGSALLKDALLRVARIADEVGVRALMVNAQDEAALAFYERFDFQPSPVDRLQLFLLMKDLRAILDSR